MRSLTSGIPLISAGLLTVGLLVPAGTAPAAATPAAGAEVCAGVPAPKLRAVRPDSRLNGMFTSYGNGNRRLDDWTGADGTYSVRLSDGRDLWIYSDTFLGRVNEDGTRPPTVDDGGTTPFVNNSFIVQKGRRLTTEHGGTVKNPTALLPPPDKNHWYWAGDGTTAGDKVEVTYQEYERFGPGAWDWRWSRNVVARFSQKRLSKPLSVTPLPSGRQIAWASALRRVGGFTYIYGVEDHDATKYMHIARVRGESLLGTWEYYAGNGTWSASEQDSARVMDGVANEYSVSRHGRVYVLVTHDTTQRLGAEIVTYYSCTPYGPFVDKTHVYTTPETGAYGSYHNANVFTYNAHAHPEIAGPDGDLVVSYNVNSFEPKDLYADAGIYRARFLDLSFN
ncbi:hypothetical protein GCM10023196_015400 [Actinoallomurus vinaceus]|uniref:DUF4185 domain-containing protein n=1 Tax=Actinoallomurus vinaceus TaxID=1080074 RepID=A0ABP8U2T8_9ACTN